MVHKYYLINSKDDIQNIYIGREEKEEIEEHQSCAKNVNKEFLLKISDCN